MSTCSGRRKSSIGILVVAIEKEQTWGENDKINEESQVRGSDYIFLPQPGGYGCNASLEGVTL
jgi:hypothetical protein